TIMYAAAGGAFGSSGQNALPNGIYKSTNSGAAWTILTGVAPSTLPTTNVGRINLAVSTVPANTVYAAIADANGDNIGVDGSLLGLFVTTDGGATWTKQTATSTASMCGSGKQCWYDMVVAVDPTNANNVYFGG